MKYKYFVWLVILALLAGGGSVRATAQQTAPAPSTADAQAPAALPGDAAAAGVLYFWDFEGTNGGFSGTLDWQWGTYAWTGTGCYNASNVPPPAAYSGTDMWGTVLNTCYSDLGNNADPCANLNPSDDSILSFTIDLAGVVGETELSWWEWYDLFGSWDWAEVRVNGDVVWQNCASHVVPTAWVQQTVDLAPYVGGPATIEFHMMSSSVVNYAGWYIDDVMITGDRLFFDIDKDAPLTAEYGEVISYTITLTPSNLLDGLFISDTLPLGVDYAGNLTWNIGNAWYSATQNAVYWEYEGFITTMQSGYASQVGPDVSLSLNEDGGSSVLDSVPPGETGATAPEAYAWTVLTAPPVETSRSAGAVDAGGNFYIIGGESTGGVRGGWLQRYDPAAGTWDGSLATMPTPLSNICAVIIGDDIYVPGGWTGSVGVIDLQVYHISTNIWEVMASDPLPMANYASACAAYDDKLYLFGGGAENAGRVYDPAAAAGSRWSSVTAPPISSSYGSALAVGDQIFYGGLGASSDFADVLAYSPATDTWEAYPDLSVGRGAAGMWAIGDLLLVGGGGWGSYLTSVEQYDTTQGTGGTWSAFEASLVQGRRTFAYATDPLHGKLFVGNGWAGAFLAEAEQLDFPVQIQITFDVTVTAHCGDVIVNQGIGGVESFTKPFTATTVVGGEAIIDVVPVSLEASVCPDTTGVQTLQICNLGDCPLSWELHEMTTTLKVVSIPPSDGNFPRGEDAPSAGPIPIDGAADGVPATPLVPSGLQILGAGAYATEQVNGFHTMFGLDAPETLPNLGAFVPGAFPGAGEYVNGYIYVADSANTLYQLDPATGAVLNSYPITAPPNGEDYSGFALDPISGVLYGSSTNVGTSSLLQVDPTTGVATLIGPITGSGCNIAIAIDGTGQMYGYDICTDDFWAIDKNSGAGTLIGSIGFDANFGQGMGWDQTTNQMYMAAFNGSTFQPELRIVDLATGNTAMVGGSLGSISPTGLCQIPWLGIPPQRVYPDIPWLSTDPITGTVPRGECLDVEVTFDATGLTPGDYMAELLVSSLTFSNDPAAPLVSIPVSMTVPEAVYGAGMSWAPLLPAAGETIDFTASVGGGTPPFTYSWNFGDGNTASGMSASHAYLLGGSYDVELTVENACGISTATETLTLYYQIYMPSMVKDH